MDGIIDQVRRMPLAEKRRLAEALRQAIAEELASGGGEPDRCPRCGCPAFVRKGRDAAGRQRWLCGGAAGPSAPARSAARPLEAARGRVDGVRGLHGRRAAAARDGGQGGGVAVHGVVHEDARLRGDGAPPAAARGESFEMDGTYFPESMPGNHSRGWFGLGRPAHRTGHDASRAGLGGSVCVLCGVSETGDCFCELAGRRRGRAGGGARSR